MFWAEFIGIAQVFVTGDIVAHMMWYTTDLTLHQVV